MLRMILTEVTIHITTAFPFCVRTYNTIVIMPAIIATCQSVMTCNVLSVKVYFQYSWVTIVILFLLVNAKMSLQHYVDGESYCLKMKWFILKLKKENLYKEESINFSYPAIREYEIDGLNENH